MNGNEFEDIIEGLRRNSLLHQYTYLLNGYIGSEMVLKNVVNTCKEMKSFNSSFQFYCDPVLGDREVGFYVPESLVSVYGEEALPVADAVFPNQFELEKLCGNSQPFESVAQVLEAIDLLHAKGPSIVIVTSVDSCLSLEDIGMTNDPMKIYMLGSLLRNEERLKYVWQIYSLST